MCDVGPRCPAGFAGRVADTERAAGSLVDGLLIGVGGNERGLLGGRGAEGAVAADAVRAEPAGDRRVEAPGRVARVDRDDGPPYAAVGNSVGDPAQLAAARCGAAKRAAGRERAGQPGGDEIGGHAPGATGQGACGREEPLVPASEVLAADAAALIPGCPRCGVRL